MDHSHQPIFSNATQLSHTQFVWIALCITSHLLKFIKCWRNKQIFKTADNLAHPTMHL